MLGSQFNSDICPQKLKEEEEDFESSGDSDA